MTDRRTDQRVRSRIGDAATEIVDTEPQAAHVADLLETWVRRQFADVLPAVED